MADVRHHAHHSAQVFTMCYIDDRNASAAAHTSHQEIPAVGGEDRTAQGVATAVVAVDRDRRAEIQFQLIVHHDAGPAFTRAARGTTRSTCLTTFRGLPN